MSEDREEAMSDRLSRLLAGDDTLEPLSDDDDMQDDSDFEYYLDAEDIDDAMGEDDGDDDDELYDDEDDDEDGPDVVFTGDIDEDEDDEGEDGDEDDDEDGGDEERIAMSELAALFSNTPGAAARNSLLARLLGGAPASQLPNSLLRRLGVTPVATQTTPEERARLLAERRRKARWWAPQLEPHPAGAELLRSGEFGRVRGWSGPAKGRRATRRCLTKRRDYIHSPSVTQASPISVDLDLTADNQRPPSQTHTAPLSHPTQASHMSVNTPEKITASFVSIISYQKLYLTSVLSFSHPQSS
jgi:hypothetical protein